DTQYRGPRRRTGRKLAARGNRMLVNRVARVTSNRAFEAPLTDVQPRDDQAIDAGFVVAAEADEGASRQAGMVDLLSRPGAAGPGQRLLPLRPDRVRVRAFLVPARLLGRGDDLDEVAAAGGRDIVPHSSRQIQWGAPAAILQRRPLRAV